MLDQGCWDAARSSSHHERAEWVDIILELRKIVIRQARNYNVISRMDLSQIINIPGAFKDFLNHLWIETLRLHQFTESLISLNFHCVCHRGRRWGNLGKFGHDWRDIQEIYMFARRCLLFSLIVASQIINCAAGEQDQKQENTLKS